jgi:hypothetical protein
MTAWSATVWVPEAASDLSVGLTRGEQPEYLELPAAQAAGPCRAAG